MELTRVLLIGLLAERCKELGNLFPPFNLFLQVAAVFGEPCEYLTEVEEVFRVLGSPFDALAALYMNSGRVVLLELASDLYVVAGGGDVECTRGGFETPRSAKVFLDPRNNPVRGNWSLPPCREIPLLGCGSGDAGREDFPDIVDLKASDMAPTHIGTCHTDHQAVAAH